MPREIINEVDVLSDSAPPVQATLGWGWKIEDGNCAALLDVNTKLNGQWVGTSVALEWGDLDRLNRAVRRAMKHYRKSVTEGSVLPTEVSMTVSHSAGITCSDCPHPDSSDRVA
jgi:hypothetical protein